MSARIDYVASWRNRLRDRVYLEFKGTNIDDIADIIAAQAQDLEDAFQSILTILSIDDSVGAMLRRLGVLVGQPWRGEDDDTYRLRVRARILVNLSSGNPEDMYPVMLAMLGLSGPGHAQIQRQPGDVAALIFRVLDAPLDPVVASVLFGMLTEASVDGVRLTMEWPTSDGEGFCFDGGTGLGWGDTTDITIGGALSGAVST